VLTAIYSQLAARVIDELVGHVVFTGTGTSPSIESLQWHFVFISVCSGTGSSLLSRLPGFVSTAVPVLA